MDFISNFDKIDQFFTYYFDILFIAIKLFCIAIVHSFYINDKSKIVAFVEQKRFLRNTNTNVIRNTETNQSYFDILAMS